MSSIQFGDKVRCKLSGFEGIAFARLEYINGCIQWGVKPKVKADDPTKVPDGFYVNEAQLEVVEKGAVSIARYAEQPGGPEGVVRVSR